MKNINYSLILNGSDFKEIKTLSQLIYLALKKENFNVSLSIKPLSNISNYSPTHSIIRVGQFKSTSCSPYIDAIISLDFHSLLNYLPFINKDTLIFSNYSAFNVCNYFLADNDMVTEKLREKTDNIYKIPVEKVINTEMMGKNKVSPYIALIGAFIAKSELLDTNLVCGELASLSKNDAENKNSIKAILAGYDYVTNEI